MSLDQASLLRAHGDSGDAGPSDNDAASVLDALLERYLNLLDEQQRLHDDLSRRMSTGFLALARANTSSPPGRHYGQDYYDERMKATRTVRIQSQKSVSEENANASDKADMENLAEHSFAITAGPGSKPENATTDAEPAESDKENEPEKETRKKRPKPLKLYRSDPIYWFGILIPPALREAQQSFIEAVQSPVPRLVSVAAEMRHLETRTQDLRRHLGV